LVLEPKKGYYEKQRVYVLDVKSLYPSMMINHNISFDTVNCDCCKNNESAKVSSEIMNLINENTSERRDQYWICKDKNYRGIVPKMLKNYRDERFRQREIGNDTTQLALKNIINGCYGLFGSKGFPYADYRVAEITTAFGRQTLNHMQLIAREVYGFDVIYGDTDSIFVTNVLAENDIKKFIAECKILRDIEVEVSETYGKFLIVKKKHYIGIPVDENKRPDIKGMEGIKSDRPSWINKIQRQLVDDIKNGANPILRIRNAYNEMVDGKVPLEDLRINLTLTNYPSHYKNNSLQKLLGSKLNATIGDTISYYKSDCQGSATINPRLISCKKYLQLLQSSLEETLKLMGYDYLRDILGYRKIQDFNE
jgi:DNA polymerase, archaea type